MRSFFLPDEPLAPSAPRDLADFVLRWDEFRPIAEDYLGDIRRQQQREMVLAWLIRLAEHVGPHDVTASERETRRS